MPKDITMPKRGNVTITWTIPDGKTMSTMTVKRYLKKDASSQWIVESNFSEITLRDIGKSIITFRIHCNISMFLKKMSAATLENPQFPDLKDIALTSGSEGYSGSDYIEFQLPLVRIPKLLPMFMIQFEDIFDEPFSKNFYQTLFSICDPSLNYQTCCRDLINAKMFSVLKDGKFDVSEYKLVLDMASRFEEVSILHDLAKTCENYKQFDACIVTLQKALKTEVPTKENLGVKYTLYFDLAEAYEKSSRLNEAVDTLQEALYYIKDSKHRQALSLKLARLLYHHAGLDLSVFDQSWHPKDNSKKQKQETKNDGKNPQNNSSSAAPAIFETKLINSTSATQVMSANVQSLDDENAADTKEHSNQSSDTEAKQHRAKRLELALKFARQAGDTEDANLLRGRINAEFIGHSFLSNKPICLLSDATTDNAFIDIMTLLNVIKSQNEEIEKFKRDPSREQTLKTEQMKSAELKKSISTHVAFIRQLQDQLQQNKQTTDGELLGLREQLRITTDNLHQKTNALNETKSQLEKSKQIEAELQQENASLRSDIATLKESKTFVENVNNVNDANGTSSAANEINNEQNETVEEGEANERVDSLAGIVASNTTSTSVSATSSTSSSATHSTSASTNSEASPTATVLTFQFNPQNGSNGSIDSSTSSSSSPVSLQRHSSTSSKSQAS